jgi:hypothetical protein
MRGCTKNFLNTKSLKVYDIATRAAICVKSPRIRSVPIIISAMQIYQVKKRPKGRMGRVKIFFSSFLPLMCECARYIKIRPRQIRSTAYAIGAKNCRGKILSMRVYFDSLCF